MPLPPALRQRLSPIDDPADPRIAGFRDIRERDLRRRDGRFIAEGAVVLRVLARSHGGPAGFSVESLLVLENRLAGIHDILAEIAPTVPIYAATGPVMDAIAGFHMHRGVLALARHDPARRSLPALLDRLPARALVVVGQGISNHDNVGAIFRNAAVFGADAVLLDETSCDPLYRKAIRVSVGGVFTVPFAREGGIDPILARLADSGFQLVGLSPSGRVALAHYDPAERTALIVGTEGEGLPPAMLDRLLTLRIPQAPGMDSLNVATASGIALYELGNRLGRLA